jgi:hypothetical protein
VYTGHYPATDLRAKVSLIFQYKLYSISILPGQYFKEFILTAVSSEDYLNLGMSSAGRDMYIALWFLFMSS